MTKRGITLIELVVAMGLFAIITTFAIGAYVTVINMKTLTKATRESQQKLRINTEIITRLSRQAEFVKLDGTGTDLQLFFDIKDPANISGARFQISGDKIYYYDRCTTAIPIATLICSNWGSGLDLFADNLRITGDTRFTKYTDRAIPELKVVIKGEFPFETRDYYRSNFEMETSVPLENVK